VGLVSAGSKDQLYMLTHNFIANSLVSLFLHSDEGCSWKTISTKEISNMKEFGFYKDSGFTQYSVQKQA